MQTTTVKPLTLRIRSCAVFDDSFSAEETIYHGSLVKALIRVR